MKINFAPAIKTISRIGLTISKYSPEILTGVGIGGFIVTVAIAINKTPEAIDILDELTADRQNAENAQEEIKVIAKGTARLVYNYMGAVIVGTGSIASILCAFGILHKRNLGLAALAEASQLALEQYKIAVQQTYGLDCDEEILQQRAEIGPRVEDERLETPFMSPYAKVFDECNPYFQRSPGYNMAFITSQQNYFNTKLRARGHVFLNEVYEALGFPHTSIGAIAGWIDGNGDNYIDFGMMDHDQKKNTVPHSDDFVNGYERSIVLDFNCDGPIYNII